MDGRVRTACQQRGSRSRQPRAGTTEIQLLSRLDARRAGTLLHRQPETDLAGTSREDAGGNGAAQYGRVRQVCRQQNALTEKSDADVGTQHPQAYQQNFRQLPRIASFIGTSNRFDLLTDPTGSRRFLCIEVKHNIDCIGIEHDQIFAQLKAELIAGRRNWFTKPEEEELQWHNEAFYRVSLVEEAVHSLFRTPLPAEKSFDLTAADIFDELQKTHPALMRGSNPMQFGSVLLRVGLKRRHTKYGNVYEVVRRKKEVSPERVER